jgi:hypothetical protein
MSYKRKESEYMVFRTPIKVIPLVLDRTKLQHLIHFNIISIILSLYSDKIHDLK